MGYYLIKRIHWYLFVSIHDQSMVYQMSNFYTRSDYLWLLAMLMTSPLVVTLGISLTVSNFLFTFASSKTKLFLLYYRFLLH